MADANVVDCACSVKSVGGHAGHEIWVRVSERRLMVGSAPSRLV